MCSLLPFTCDRADFMFFLILSTMNVSVCPFYTRTLVTTVMGEVYLRKKDKPQHCNAHLVHIKHQCQINLSPHAWQYPFKHSAGLYHAQFMS
ncbi:hypothetical protein PENTCL1PPCAC_24514 [Pristionchus entomophagus]|uniref:Secreted protein n=1 Tax=Pristionchus entomophagus TaxID=358040 RepID=A0AAV5U814_9BILA|nr:hypothetical protein PENTCL1PPCAC_24514 [Pristionchus entomophagus]